MTRPEMIAALDEEIRRLQTVHTLLEQSQRRTAGLIPKEATAQLRTKRTMTPEGRQRIIEAQRRRWAKQKRDDGAKARKSAA
jgi:hypothetical protein